MVDAAGAPERLDREARLHLEGCTCPDLCLGDDILAVTTALRSAEARIAALEAALEPLEAWALLALDIARDRRVLSRDTIGDGEEIIKLARAALAAGPGEG